MVTEQNLSKKSVLGNFTKNMSPFFIKNQGQVDSSIKYYALNGNFSCYLTSQEAVFSFVKKDDVPTSENNLSIIETLQNDILNSEPKEQPPESYNGVAVYLKFLEANENVEILTQYECSSKINYLKGDDPNNWYQNLATYEKIVYKNLWSNIDLTFYIVKGELKYELTVHPDASLDDIKLSYLGGDIIILDEDDSMVIMTNIGAIVDKKPMSYQIIGDTKVIIESKFALKSTNIFNFEIDDSYDKSYPLVIDPGLEYSTYLGGNNEDVGSGIVADNNGNAYIVGRTLSTNFPSTPGAFQPIDPFNGNDVFVTKINTKASRIDSLVYSTYLGGNGDDEGRGISIDSNGFAYVTGRTTSANFPTTPLTAYQPTIPLPQGNSNAFITKLSANGSSLLYSSYLGGNNFDSGVGIAVDDDENAYITGSTFSTNFPTTSATAYQPTDPSTTSYDAFISKINTRASGSASLVYSTYLGGNDADYPLGIAVDNIGNAYVTGDTLSTNFPTTSTAYQPTDPSTTSAIFSAFISKINTLASGATSLAYSTYLGGTSNDIGQGIAVDDAGNAYITGSTNSINFPLTPLTAYQTARKGNTEAFVSKINTLTSGNASLVYSTYLGGSNTDVGVAIAIDNFNNAYVTGYTLSTNFPITPLTAYQPTKPNTGTANAFVSKLNTLASGNDCLVYSTYLGGNNTDFGQGISVDKFGTFYITGHTLSTNFPTTPLTAYQPTNPLPASKDAFATKISTNPEPSRGILLHDLL